MRKIIFTPRDIKCGAIPLTFNIAVEDHFAGGDEDELLYDNFVSSASSGWRIVNGFTTISAAYIGNMSQDLSGGSLFINEMNGKFSMKTIETDLGRLFNMPWAKFNPTDEFKSLEDVIDLLWRNHCLSKAGLSLSPSSRLPPEIINELLKKQRQFYCATTLENKFDIAYEIYIKIAAQSVSLSADNKNYLTQLRQEVTDFMKIVLNVTTDSEIKALAEERKRMKVCDPLYLPKRAPIGIVVVGESEAETTAKKRARYHWKFFSKLAVARKHEITLKVTDNERWNDERDHHARLNHEECAPYRIVLANGIFYKLGEDNQFEPVDTTNLFSKGIPGYLAYTINTRGEISAFIHPRSQKQDSLVHSSMNPDAQVFAAGDLKIVKGKLTSIVAFSGHYLPSIENAYRTLKYLQRQGVDVQPVIVALFEKANNLTETRKEQQREPHGWPTYNASDLVSLGDQLQWNTGESAIILSGTRMVLLKLRKSGLLTTDNFTAAIAYKDDPKSLSAFLLLCKIKKFANEKKQQCQEPFADYVREEIQNPSIINLIVHLASKCRDHERFLSETLLPSALSALENIMVQQLITEKRLTLSGVLQLASCAPSILLNKGIQKLITQGLILKDHLNNLYYYELLPEAAHTLENEAIQRLIEKRVFTMDEFVELGNNSYSAYAALRTESAQLLLSKEIITLEQLGQICNIVNPFVDPSTLPTGSEENSLFLARGYTINMLKSFPIDQSDSCPNITTKNIHQMIMCLTSCTPDFDTFSYK